MAESEGKFLTGTKLVWGGIVAVVGLATSVSTLYWTNYEHTHPKQESTTGGPAIKGAPASKSEDAQLFKLEPDEHGLYPGVMANYPNDWYEVPGGSGSPRIVPRPETTEGKLGVEITVTVTTTSNKTIEAYAGAVLPGSPTGEPESLTSAEHLRLIKRFVEEVDGSGEQGKLIWRGERLLDASTLR